ncbi:MAG: diguanylate cyclase, partial [Gammaproteobacteria bacterium]|nr:diguanylate cyclase [Gammaproteobacteria bacterium]
MFRPVSLRYGIPLLIVLFTALLAVYTVRRDRRSAEALVHGYAVSQMVARMSSLKALLDYAFRTEDARELEERLAVLGTELAPDEAIVTDPSAVVLAATHSRGVGHTLFSPVGMAGLPETGEALEVVVNRVRSTGTGEVHMAASREQVVGFCPIAFGAENAASPRSVRTGVLIIRKDLSSLLASALDTAEQQTTEMVAILIAMAAILGILIHFFVTRRLYAVVRAAQRFAAGDLDIRTALGGSDEAAVLSRAFDRMANQVAHQQRELERRVRERTEDLAQTVAELKAEVAKRERTQRALSVEKERIQVTLASIGDAVMTVDLTGLIQYLNPAAKQLTGWAGPDAIGHPFAEVLHLILESSRMRVVDPLSQCIVAGEVVHSTEPLLLVRPDGEERSVEHSAAPIRDLAGQVIGTVLAFRDTTTARQAARQLSYQASHDALTGLWNRSAFEQRLEVLLAAGDTAIHTVVYLDLDQFKIVNDTCGHAAGDELLRQFTAVLGPLIRRRDMLARLGGDEFGLLLEHCPREAALRVATGIQAALSEFRFVWEDHGFQVGASIGLVAVQPGLDTLGSVFSSADIACYLAKEKGGRRIHVYETDDSELAQRQGEMQWVPRIQEALAAERFELFFQPIIHLTKPSGVHGEMLLRLRDAQGRLVPPGAFIPAAERYNQIQSIDRWVVSASFRALAKLCRVTPSPFLGINLSGQSVSDAQFLEYVERQADETKVPLHSVCFEITETAAISNLSAAGRFFSALKPRGCLFALDDFGSGLSSFAYLKTL